MSPSLSLPVREVVTALDLRPACWPGGTNGVRLAKALAQGLGHRRETCWPPMSLRCHRLGQSFPPPTTSCDGQAVSAQIPHSKLYFVGRGKGQKCKTKALMSSGFPGTDFCLLTGYRWLPGPRATGHEGAGAAAHVGLATPLRLPVGGREGGRNRGLMNSFPGPSSPRSH